MFGTLHYNAGRNETQYVERSNGVVEHGGKTASHFQRRLSGSPGSVAYSWTDETRFQLKCDG